MGVAMLFVPTLKILSQWFRGREFATMTGLLMAMGGLGSMISTAPLAFMSNLIGWRNVFYTVGGCTLLLAAAVWLIVRDQPSDAGLAPIAEKGDGSLKAISLKAGIAAVLREKGFWVLGGWFFFTLAIFFSFGGLWGGPYLIDLYHVDKAKAGAILSMLSLGMIAGSPLLSLLSNRIMSRKRVILAAGFINCIITALLAFKTAGLSIPMLYILCFCMGVSASAIVVIGFTSCKELFPVAIAGTSTGLINLFPFAGGAVFQQILGAILQSHGRVDNAFTPRGYSSAFLALFLSSVAALLFSFRIKETFR
jgi:sugar phosphate permease